MKIYTNKFDDVFYIPVVNTSSRDELSYKLTVDDTYGILSIENTVGPGPRNDIYITVPKVPSIAIPQGVLYAKKRQSGEYYLEISEPNSAFRVYENGKRFHLFYSNGNYSDIYVDLTGYNGEFPNFLISETSLKEILSQGSSLPTETSPVLLNSPFSISTEFQVKNFLRVSTRVVSKGTQKASIFLTGLTTSQQTFSYEFVIDAVDSPVKSVEKPPIGLKDTDTVQLARSFFPMSSTITLQLDSFGELYMDKLGSGSSASQGAYRRRCTNLGFEKDLARFCSSIPKTSIYELEEEDVKNSSQVLSEQYFTDLNSGVSINHETPEAFRAFAPIWIKDRVPSYFAIFRKSPTHQGENLMEGASLVQLIDIRTTELGPYLNSLVSDQNFSRPPLEVSIDNGYQLRWNGVSVDTGYWVSHTEFMGVDIQQGLSDFEFSEMLSGGFSRGSVISPQMLNIEFLFNDNQSKLYDVNQYFGLYCDDVEIGSFLPNVDSTFTMFGQNQSRQSSNADFNSSVISNSNGVKLVVDLNDVTDRNLSVVDPSLVTINSQRLASSYEVSILPTNQASRRLKVAFTSDVNITSVFSPGKQIRLNDKNGLFVAYVTVSSSEYDSLTKTVQVSLEENDEYSGLGLSYFINIFDISPDPSIGIFGRMRFDSESVENARCICISKRDTQGNDIVSWLKSIIDTASDTRDVMVFFDKYSSAYSIVAPISVVEESNYVKVFFDVIESDGRFLEGDEVFVNVSDYQVSGTVPGPKLVSSSSRKFILKSKTDAYSVREFNFSNYKNSVVGVVSLDSTTFNLGSIVGTDSNDNIPVKIQESLYPGVTLKFSTITDETISMGDRITIQRTIGQTTRRWSVIRSETPQPGEFRTSGATTELEIIADTLVSNDNYTEFEIPADKYFPVRFDDFYLIESQSQQSNIKLDFIQAESQDNGNYLLRFSNRNLSTDYLALRVVSPETTFTYFNYGPSDSLETVLAVAFQRFIDCPFRSIVGNQGLYLYSLVSEGEISLGLYLSSGTITQMQINGQYLKPQSIRVESSIIPADYYVYSVDQFDRSTVYSTQEQFLSRLESGTRILSKSGTPSGVSLWNNGSYGIPDVRSFIDDSQERYLIKFEGNNVPSLLNDRLQLINFNTVSMSLLSFYDFVDLDFFEEIPSRVGQGIEGTSALSLSSGSSLFSNAVKTATSIRSSTPSTNTKTLVLSANIAENLYSDWKDWNPQNNPDFLGFGSLRGSVSPGADTLPLAWNPSYGFKIEYLDKDKNWVNYPISLPTANVVLTNVLDYRSYPPSQPMWNVEFDLGNSTPNAFPFNTVQGILNQIYLYMYSRGTSPQTITSEDISERLRSFSNIKSLVSYCFSQLCTDNIDTLSNQATYVCKIDLQLDSDHLDYRYVCTFPDGTYTVKEEDVQVQGNKQLTGVPSQNIMSNFSTSVDSSSGKIKASVSRWKRTHTTNVDMSPYLINVDPLLLPYDMFVNATEGITSPTSFSLDWYLISGWPKFYELNGASGNYQYIGKRIDIDNLKSIEYDYFTEYFTVGQGEETFVNGEERSKKFLWETIKLDQNGYTTTFKGIPLNFSSPKANLEGTRFSAVLQIEKDMEVPTKTSLIYNRVWNCLTLFVQINVDSYFVDGSIGLEQLYDLKTNSARTDGTALYGPMLVYGEEVLGFDKVDRAYNENEVVILNQPIEGVDYYEYNQYQYINETKIRYDSSAKDIELFGVRYFPGVDYLISGKVFVGTRYQTNVDLIVPRSRVRGVFDPELGRNRTLIDGLYGDDFFAILSDIDGSPIATYAKFVSQNTIKIEGPITVSNSYYSNPTSVTFDGITGITSASVYAIGDFPVYEETIGSVSISSMLGKLKSSDFNDVMVLQDGQEAKTNISIDYLSPSIVRPIKTKIATIDENGIVVIRERDNDIDIFRLDGGFEPSYKNLIEFAASEDQSITRPLLNSLRGYNTKLLGVNTTNLWYRRVSQQGVNTGTININGTLLNVPYALGRKSVSPASNVWGEGFYSIATDNFVDVPIEGIKDPMEQRFFLASKSMSVPTFFRTSEYSVSESTPGSNTNNVSVTYMFGENRISLQMDFDSIISDYLFNAGIFSFFSSIESSLGQGVNPYETSKQYIDRNLLNRYSVESIDVYQRPNSRTEVISLDTSPEQEGFTLVNTIGIQQVRFFDFSIPVDGSKQVALAFNIKRR